MICSIFVIIIFQVQTVSLIFIFGIQFSSSSSLALSIPISEREFIQWKGRTARSDRQGQYAVILNSEKTPLKDNEEKWKEHTIKKNDEEESKSTNDAGFVYKESVIKELLSLSDKKANSKLEGLKKKITGGQRLNELCDLFYKKHSGGDCGKWPIGKTQIQLRDFLKGINFDYTTPTKNEISEFAVAVGIVSSKGEWNRITKYK